MEIIEKLSEIAAKLEKQKSAIQTEEATKTAFVMPFINNVLGYDVFNPLEVTPELTADVATKKGEKVDYAILKSGEVQILIECKKLGDELNLKHSGQLFRYFSVTNARIAILTNGQVYKFYTDLDAPNKMDEKPFLVLDLLDVDDHVIPELIKLTKPAFDLESIISAAGELKYVSQIKRVIAKELSEPSEEFIKFFASRVYEGPITQKVRDQFTGLTNKAVKQFLNDKVNDRLKSALSNSKRDIDTTIQTSNETPASTEQDDDGIFTTVEELEGYNVVKAIVRSVVDVKRIAARDTKSYFGVLLDDNNRKPICRLHFNRSQKYIGLFDNEKNETRHPIDGIDDIFRFTAELCATAKSYE
jgi:hypothetical protein|tara:strand:+ start:6986 stop:8062 length:1077 start_codon:yes stop_codon:yes gene_type:complete